MKRFINLTDQIIDDEPRFAFYCTVKDMFDTFSGCQTWSSIDDFKMDFKGTDDELKRYLGLIPEDFFALKKFSKAILSLKGKQIETIPLTYKRMENILGLEQELKEAIQEEDYEKCQILKERIELLKKIIP